jgi:hypothetical protein
VHRDYFAQHRQTVVNYVNFAAFSAIPAHRNLSEVQSGAMGEKKELDIESEALDSCCF